MAAPSESAPASPQAGPQPSAAATRALLCAPLAGAALLSVMFLRWYGPSATAKVRFPGSSSTDAWVTFTKLDLVLCATAVLGAGFALVLGGMSRRRGVPGWTLLGGAVVGAIGLVGATLL